MLSRANGRANGQEALPAIDVAEVRPSEARAVPVVGGAFSGIGSLDVIDEGRTFPVRLDAPGVAREDVDVTIEGADLTIRARRNSPASESGKAIRQGRRAFDIARTVALPAPVAVDGIHASMRDGVLEVTIPKSPDAMPRRIPIHGG